MGVKEFVGQRAGDGFDGFALLWGERSQSFRGAGEFGLTESFGGLLQGEDGGHSVESFEALLVAGDLVGDDLFGGSGLAVAVGLVSGGNLREVVDIVDEAAFDLVHAGVHVARDGNVYEEHRASAALLEELLAVGFGKDLFGSSGGGDDDVGACGLVVQVVERDDLDIDAGLVELGSDAFGAHLSTVGEEDVRGSVADEVADGQFRHLAGTDHHDGFTGERAEDLAS